VVNLAGKPINCRLTPANRREIIDSRVESIGALGAAWNQCQSPPKVWIQASAVGFYGNAGDRICDENTPPGDTFESKVCVAWENEFQKQDLAETRRVVLRFGVVLSANGGALPALATMTRMFLGGTVGNGRQFVSWIHIDDVCRIVQRAIENESMTGTFNSSSPNPVPNAQFMAALRKVLKRPWSPPAPKIAVHIGAFIIGADPALALHSQRCVPRRLLESGYDFRHAEIENCFLTTFARRDEQRTEHG
jgi:uncharacterized protein (TIGR01777 family)